MPRLSTPTPAPTPRSGPCATYEPEPARAPSFAGRRCSSRHASSPSAPAGAIRRRTRSSSSACRARARRWSSRSWRAIRRSRRRASCPTCSRWPTGSHGRALAGYPDALAALPRLGDPPARPRLHRPHPAAAPRCGRPRFIDKAPWNWMHVGLIRLMLPNAKIIDVRRHPLGLLRLGLPAALRRRLRLRLRPRRPRPLLRRLRGPDGALRRRPARPCASGDLRGPGRGHRGARCAGCWTTSACRSIRPACASSKPSGRWRRPAPSRCASRSSPMRWTTGAATSHGWVR